MSFLKIKDPIERERIFDEFQKSKNNIQRNFQSERLGDAGLQRELTKLYSPIVNSQSAISKDLLSAIKESSMTTSNALQALPASISSSLKTIQFPQYPAITEDPIEDVRSLEFGDIATKYLRQSLNDKKIVDTTFGIRDKNGQFYIGDSPISIQSDDVTVGNKTYLGTPGLWELMTMKKPDETIYNSNDLEEYAEILNVTNAIRQENNQNKPRSSTSIKYKTIIKPIWERIAGKVGKGVEVPVIVIPQDPNALAKQLELLINSFNAGNTGARNEIVAICDELLRQDVIKKDEYKNIISRL